MSNTREQLRQELVEAFRAARKVRIGSELIIGTSAEVEPIIKKALARGETVHENGTAKWIDTVQVCNLSKDGSAMFTWDKSGNKVRAEKFLYIEDDNGVITSRSLGFVFENFI